MSAKDLFTVILKIIGIYLIKEVLVAIPSVLNTVILFSSDSLGYGLFSLFISLLSLGVYVGIVYVLLFRTTWLITRLRLTDGVREELMQMKIHRSVIYTIAIIVSGIVILTFSIPSLIKGIYYWTQYIDLRNRLLTLESFDYMSIVIPLTEVLIGLLFIGNQRMIINFIESRKKQTVSENKPQ